MGMLLERWRYGALRRCLVTPNSLPLFAFLDDQIGAFEGMVLNVGSGLDERPYGRRVIRLDGFAPSCDIRADLRHHFPLRDGSVDGVICAEVIEHVPDHRLVLEEIARVLKPGGRAVITTPFNFHYHPDPEDYRRFTPYGLRAEVERVGLRSELAGGIGNKATALVLLIDALHPVFKVLLRVIVLVLSPFIPRPRPREGRWSDFAAHAVCVARKPLAGSQHLSRAEGLA
jgi:SAM-dependent methyltransferase